MGTRVRTCLGGWAWPCLSPQTFLPDSDSARENGGRPGLQGHWLGPGPPWWWEAVLLIEADPELPKRGRSVLLSAKSLPPRNLPLNIWRPDCPARGTGQRGGLFLKEQLGAERAGRSLLGKSFCSQPGRASEQAGGRPGPGCQEHERAGDECGCAVLLSGLRDAESPRGAFQTFRAWRRAGRAPEGKGREAGRSVT